MGVVRDGSDKIALVAKVAKIKESTAREAILRLETAGSITREGKGRSTRYIAA